MRFQVDEQSDYVYAFEDFLHALMRLGDGRGTGFSAEANGAFKVDREENLQPALHALAQRVWQNRRHTPLSPQSHVKNQSIHLEVSDDHRLPSTAAKALYTSDNVTGLKVQKMLEGRLHSIVNDNDADWERIDKDLDSFIENVVHPYKAMADQAPVNRKGSATVAVPAACRNAAPTAAAWGLP
jgi:hypothetical protein